MHNLPCSLSLPVQYREYVSKEMQLRKHELWYGTWLCDIRYYHHSILAIRNLLVKMISCTFRILISSKVGEFLVQWQVQKRIQKYKPCSGQDSKWNLLPTFHNIFCPNSQTCFTSRHTIYPFLCSETNINNILSLEMDHINLTDVVNGL